MPLIDLDYELPLAPNLLLEPVKTLVLSVVLHSRNQWVRLLSWGKNSVFCGKWQEGGLECSVWSVQCSVWSVECGVFSVQCSVWSVQCLVFRDWNLEFRKVYSELWAFLVFFVVKIMLHIWTTKIERWPLTTQYSILNTIHWLLTTDHRQLITEHYLKLAPNWLSKLLWSLLMILSICVSVRVFESSCKMKLTAYDFFPSGRFFPV